MLANMLADESQTCSKLASGQARLGCDSHNSASTLAVRLDTKALPLIKDFRFVHGIHVAHLMLNS